jgi:DEAD/DEAH box helicase domain-containing protein
VTVPNTVFFDVETQFLAEEVGGWDHIHKMELAVAVTYSSADALFRHYGEAEVADLVDELRGADLVVGFNVLRFDYEVLRAYTEFPLWTLPTVDMLDYIHRALGFRLSLDAVASATLNTTKSADGIQAVHWFRQGEIEKVRAYCQRDVEVTRDLYEFGKQYGYVQFQDRNYRLRKVPVRW